MAPVHLEIHLLGPFRLLYDGRPAAGFDQARLQHLLAYLVLHRATPLSREQLAFLFWPDTSDQQARKNFRTLLTRLRQALPHADDFIEVTTRTVQWRADATFTLDVAVFEDAVAEAEAHTDSPRAAAAQMAAVAAWTGDLLPDCYDDWALPRREELRQAFAETLEQLVLSLEQQRDYHRALGYAQRLLRHDPLHEPAYRYLMRLHLALDERAEARRVYAACEEMLRREFGVAPDRTTRDLYDRLVVADEVSLTAAVVRQRAPGPATLPLVGRQTEWADLLSAWSVATADRPGMILLIGEAGIGKTRLAEELLDWVARQGAATAAAQCTAAGGVSLAYAPVAEWLRDPSLQPRLAALDDPARIEVGRILPALLAAHPHLAAPGPLTEAWQRTRLFDALARATLGPPGEHRQPLLLLLDDLQWIDRETLDWLAYLLRYNACAPLLIVCTVRPQEVDRDHPLTLFRLTHLQAGLLREIPLLPLDAAETAALATAVAGREMDAAEASRLYQDTAGNPLFIVEFMRARRHALESETQPDAWGPQPAGVSRELPARVRAVIQWRLARLSPAAQAVAQMAAVIGRRFNLAVLCRSSDQDEHSVVEGLTELWQRQLIRAQGADAYDFSHEGIRAVAYEELGPVRQHALHLRVAQALEMLHEKDPDAPSSLIAMHYERAGHPRAAVHYYRRAGAAAQRLYAHSEAVSLYSHLLEDELRASLSARESCEIMLTLAEVWRMTGLWVRARAMLQEALAIAETLADSRLVAQTQAALAGVLHLLGYYDAALEWLARAEARFRSTGEWRGVVSTLWTLGQSHWFRGDYPQALAILERQLQLATEIADESGTCEALETLGMVHGSLGDCERAADCCLKAIDIAGRLGYRQIITRASITLGNVRASQHWFGEAVYWYQNAGVLAHAIDDRQAISWAASNIALLLARRGDYARAAAGYEHSLRNAWEIGDRWTACLNLAGLATVYEHLGQAGRAESLYRTAIRVGYRLHIRAYVTGMLVSLARCLLAQGRAAEARALHDEALAQMAGVAGPNLSGEDTHFDTVLLGIRLRLALSELTAGDAAAELRTLLRGATPPQQAALRYELWQVGPEEEAVRAAAAQFYRTEHAETGAEQSRIRYHELTGDTLPDPPPLPDISLLVPDTPTGLDLDKLVAELEASFDGTL